MPVYDYLCTSCDHRADILHGINDPGPNFCPSCGAEGTMRKQFAAPAVHFKGSGWAKKDRGSASTTRAAARSSSEGDKAGSSERARDDASDRAHDGAGERARDTKSDQAGAGPGDGAQGGAKGGTASPESPSASSRSSQPTSTE